MLLTVIQPDIKPNFCSYQTLTGQATVNVGFSVDSLNSTIAYDVRKYTLKDSRGNIVQAGTVSVKLNSFDTTLTFYNLLANTFYTLNVYNEISGSVSEAVIATGNITAILDENSVLPSASTILTTDKLAIDNGKIHFKQSTDFATLGNQLTNGVYLGNSLVYIDGFLYAFKPNRLLTYNADIPSTIAYIPFIGQQESSVEVVQLATITKVAHLLYEVSPASTMIAFAGDRTFTFKTPTTFIDLTQEGLPQKTPIVIEQTFI